MRQSKLSGVTALYPRSHGWENGQHPGFFQPTLELCDGQTQPGGLQHSVPGGPPDTSPAGAPHNRRGVLPLLLLSPCQQLLLLLLWRHYGNLKVRNKEEEGLSQYWWLMDLCQDRPDDTWQGRSGHGVEIHFLFSDRSSRPRSGSGVAKTTKLKLSRTHRRLKTLVKLTGRTSHCSRHGLGWNM